MRAFLGAILLAALGAGCASHPPAHWAQGGSKLALPRARLSAGDVVVDVMPDGRVLGNGDYLFSMDAAGRIFDVDNDPIALLEADGRLVGKDERNLGYVGLRNASPPGGQVAWLTIEDTGNVVRFDPEGTPFAGGVWSGCGPALRTCTLTTHILALLQARARGGSRMRIGVGMGVGMGSGAAGVGTVIMP
ncbi:MAG: hypothetical protein ABW133_03015 [Polyangiaceae bacterium]